MTKPALCAINKHLEIPEHVIPGGWVVGGMTRLLDVWTPSPLVMRAPSFRYAKHQLKFSFDECVSKPIEYGKRSRLKQRIGIEKNRIYKLSESDIFYDCRHDATENVAHVLQNQLAIALTALQALGLEDRWRDLVFVVPAGTPSYSIRLFEVMGFRVITNSSEAISGWQVRMEPKKFPLRAIGSVVLRKHAVDVGILSDSDPDGDPVFLSRRARRTLTNMDEIEPIVNKAGYRTVFAEDIPVEEQIQIIARSKGIFALHGAAMGYIMFRDSKRHGVVIECFPCGYATGWARAICSQTGDTWLGGQGDLVPKVLIDLVDDRSARAHQSSDYRLEPQSVQILQSMESLANSTDEDIDPMRMLDGIKAMDIPVAKIPRKGGSL